MTEKKSVVVITGAGSGLGAALAVAYANRGATVVLGARSVDKLAQVAEQISSTGGTCFCLPVDISNDDSVLAFVTQSLQVCGQIDILINNAGVCAAGNIIDTSIEDWHWTINTNLIGAVRTCRAVIPVMQRAGCGSIVNIASFAGIANAPAMAAYNASKAALISLSETMRLELHDNGINISVSCPSFFVSNLDKSLRTSDAALQYAVQKLIHKSGVSSEKIAEQIIDAVQRKQFLILHQGQSKRLYWLKRLSTTLFTRVLLHYMRIRNAKSALKQKAAS